MTAFERVALVTGGARGIGRAVVERLAMAGLDVAVNDREADAALEQACAAVQAQGQRALAVPGDVGDRAAVEDMVAAAVAELGSVDVLVNNAGIFRFAPFLELQDDAVWDVLRVDLAGAFYCSQTVARHLVARGAPGRIVMISSVSAHIAQRRQAHYCAAKAGLEMMAKTMAVELAAHQITVNCVAPGGPILTDYTRPLAQGEQFEATVKRRVPLGRPGQPEDVAGAVAYLASEEAGFVTGAVLVVDGGLILARD